MVNISTLRIFLGLKQLIIPREYYRAVKGFGFVTLPKVVPEYKDQAKIRIIKAACAVFQRKGVINTTMDDIAREVGVSKGAVYPYFPSKTQLLIGVMGHLRDELKLKIERVAELDDVPGGVGRVLDTYFQQVFDPAVWNLLAAEAASDPEVREALRGDQQEGTRVVRELLRRLEAAGRIPHQADPDETAEAIVMLVAGAFAMGYQRGDMEAARRTLVRTLGKLVGLTEPTVSQSVRSRVRPRKLTAPSKRPG